MDSKYVQQHLTYERTYLARVRTSITMVGLGFLAAGVVFRSSPYTHWGHLLAAIIGIGSVICGSLLTILATKDYFKKRAGINQESFRSIKFTVVIVSIGLTLINLLLIVLVIIL
ncbi:YidH family protein [Brevibacillus choshinensis]|uniref:YidH family protein n=1 Tax=Brevibacillus choshinensis TaxID=54911 RepID=UPI0023B048A4|nr:DUF202 domain-containing protein [Brevibacillus choshinensis]